MDAKSQNSLENMFVGLRCEKHFQARGQVQKDRQLVTQILLAKNDRQQAVGPLTGRLVTLSFSVL